MPRCAAPIAYAECARRVQASEHRNIQQLFPFAIEGVLSEDPRGDWATHTFIVWLELMVRAPLSGRACACMPVAADARFTMSQMLRHRRNQPPGYTAAALKEIQSKADEFVALLKQFWLPYQASKWMTIKARACLCVCGCAERMRATK